MEKIRLRVVKDLVWTNGKKAVYDGSGKSLPKIGSTTWVRKEYWGRPSNRVLIEDNYYGINFHGDCFEILDEEAETEKVTWRVKTFQELKEEGYIDAKSETPYTWNLAMKRFYGRVFKDYPIIIEGVVKIEGYSILKEYITDRPLEKTGDGPDYVGVDPTHAKQHPVSPSEAWVPPKKQEDNIELTKNPFSKVDEYMHREKSCKKPKSREIKFSEMKNIKI